jgi:hypothetical protein
MPGVYNLLSVCQFSQKMLETYPESSFVVLLKVRLFAPDVEERPLSMLVKSTRGTFLEEEGVYVRTKPLLFPLKEGEAFPSMELVEESRETTGELKHLVIVGYEVHGKYDDTTPFSFSVVSDMDHFSKGCGCYMGQEDVHLTCEAPKFLGKKFVGGVSKKLQDLIADCCGCYYS